MTMVNISALSTKTREEEDNINGANHSPSQGLFSCLNVISVLSSYGSTPHFLSIHFNHQDGTLKTKKEWPYQSDKLDKKQNPANPIIFAIEFRTSNKIKSYVSNLINTSPKAQNDI